MSLTPSQPEGESARSRARMRLYADRHYASPYAMSVFVALREKRLDFEMQVVDLGAKGQDEPSYAAQSLTRRVPTLVDGDFALSESSAITEYLDETFAGRPLYPRNRHDRARARQVQAWLRSDLMPIREERSTEVVFYGVRMGPLSPIAQAAARKLYAAAEALLADGRQCLFGDWSIADVDLALMLNRLVLNGDEVPSALVAYAGRQWENAAIREWVGLMRPSN